MLSKLAKKRDGLARAALVLALLSSSAGTVACDTTSVVGYSAAAESLTCDSNGLLACDDAACVVQELGEASVGSTGLAADDEHVYFQRSPRVLSKVAVGGGSPIDLVTTVDRLVQIAVDRTHVYWTQTQREIWRVPKAGGSAERVIDLDGHPTAIALDDTRVYATLTDTHQVVMVPKAGGRPTFAPDQDLPAGITVDGSHVYWVNTGTAAGAGELIAAELGDLSTAQVLASGLDAPTVVAAGPDDVYVAGETMNVIAVAKTGGEPRTVATVSGKPVKAMTAFSDSVYCAGMGGLERITAGDVSVLEPRPILTVAASCSGLYASGWFESLLLRYSAQAEP